MESELFTCLQPGVRVLPGGAVQRPGMAPAAHNVAAAAGGMKVVPHMQQQQAPQQQAQAQPQQQQHVAAGAAVMQAGRPGMVAKPGGIGMSPTGQGPTVASPVVLGSAGSTQQMVHPNAAAQVMCLTIFCRLL